MLLKKEVIKKIKMLPILLHSLLFISGINLGCMESVHNNMNRKYYVGKFKFDLNKSDLGDLQTENYIYESLTLELLDNDSFKFSMNAPFLRQQRGKWTMNSVDNLYTAYLLYENNGEGVFIKDKLIITPDLEIKISTPFGNSIVGKENQKYAKHIYFKKQVNF